ncbi:iron-sulfur cluster assembly scaffold protein SufA [Enterobacter cloacae]|uniref:iron-sulfur cluster assembly scaffold protein SufA n=1 Tax=Enterobacter cloacae TaxID=550 RepID=UPI00317F8B1A
MKKKSTHAAVAAIVASLTASLAPVPAKSASLPATAVESRAHHNVSTALTFELPGGQIFLPLDEATEYLTELNKSQRFLLQAIIQERQAKGKGSLFSNVKDMKAICLDGIEQNLRVKEAVSIVMQPDNLAKTHPDNLGERAHYRSQLMRFGRAIAQGEFILRDILSALEQSKAPKNTVSLTGMPSDTEVKALIAAEHKNLGLSAPEFS